MEKDIREYHGKSKGLARVRQWLLGLLTPVFAVCLAVGLFLSVPMASSLMSYANDISVNPLINSNIGKHSEWYYGFGSVKDVKQSDVTGGYANWYAQLGVDTGEVKVTYTDDEDQEKTKSITQSAREHQLVQASSYKEGATDKVFIINTPEEAAKVWTEAVEYALGQSKDSPFHETMDQTLDPITGKVQTIPGGGIARGNYFADPYTIKGINNDVDQTSYRGQYITVKLNCDWYAKDIKTNIAFALGNSENLPSEQTIPEDKYRWITTFNWAANETAFKSYWLREDNWAESKDAKGNLITRESIRTGYSQGDQFQTVRSDESTVKNEITTAFAGNGDGYTSTDGYYASYDLSTLADQTANCGGKPGFNISSPFSYGRINVPTGAYIVLDLNGHTISRGLTEENNEEVSYHGSILKSKYEYDLGEMDELNKFVKIYDGSTLGEHDDKGHLYGNELCYYGSVIEVQPKARLEIVDSTAYERASDGRIDSAGNTYTTNHKGTISGGCTDDKYYVYMDNDLGVENGAYFGYNSNEGKGGAVHVNASGELVVHSGTFKDNQAMYGGAFYALSRAAVLVYNGYFINNYATIHGGATYVASLSRSVFTFYDGVISYNRAAQTGGGVFLRDNAYVNLHGGYITHNQAGYQGGGVYIGEKGEGLLENVTVTQNVAGDQGGGIYVFKSSKFEFAGSLIVTQNYGKCGDFNTREVGEWGGKPKEEMYNGLAGTTFRTPYILRLKVNGELVQACGTPSQGRYDWSRSEGDLTLTSGYTKCDNKQPCSHKGSTEGSILHTADYPKWSMGDAFSKEYNGIGGVVWKNAKGGQSAHGDVTKIAAEGSANNVYLENGATIIVGGSLFQNGIGAQIGVTMAGSGNFTKNYKETEKSVIPQLYFTSDDPEKSVTWSADGSEATLGGTPTKPTELTWEITGYLYGSEKEITITASGTGEVFFNWNTKTGITGTIEIPKGADSAKDIESFKWTNKTMMFDHKMFEVTQVVAKAGEEIKATWTIGKLKGTEDDGSSHTAGVDYTFHYLLAKQGDENEATDGRLVYAGDYSFRVIDKNATVYSNATFTITINQLGVGVSAYEVKDGEVTWKDRGNPFAEGADHGPEAIEKYLKDALYYRGTPYDFVLDSRFITDDGPDKGKVKDSAGNVSTEKFTGAVMKFIYANEDFFGKGVEVDFTAVDFDLEYYWRELTDNSQKDLEKTNYFLHAGYYEVRGAHEVVSEGSKTPAVDYMKNNIAFESEMHLPIQRVSVSVWLENNACVKDEGRDGYFGYTFKDGVYTTKQILYFNNNDEAGNDPELDKNVVVKYYDFDDYMQHGDKAKEVGIVDRSDGVERWGVREAGKYVVHVSLNTMMWVENGDPAKDDFTDRGKPYNDYIFTSSETQRLELKSEPDEQGRMVQYEFAYYFFIQPAVITKWEDALDPTKPGAGHLNLSDRVYDATDTEPTLSGKMKSATVENAYYPFDEFTGDTENVYVRYLEKTDKNTDNLGKEGEKLKDAYRFTYADVKKYGAKKAGDLATLSGGEKETAISKWFQGDPKFKPVDAGEYWILVWFRGVSPETDNIGNDMGAVSYVPVTNFKGVFIGTYTVKPVEVTVSGSLSYTYDGRSYERARYLKPSTSHDYEWYESIFFLVQDNNTTSNKLIEGQDGDISGLDDLWGGTNDDMHRYQSRFTLTLPTVSFSSEAFKESENVSLGIGLYSFNTGNANVQSSAYHLTTVAYDEKGKTDDGEGGTNTEPTNEGVTWLISYASGDKQTQKFNTSQNFVINAADSWLNVTIQQKDLNELAPDITKVGDTDFKHWDPNHPSIEGAKATLALAEGDVKTGISYPFAGNDWKYEPGVTVSYQPFYYATSVKNATGKTAYGDPLSLTATDYSTSWMNNSSASTDSNTAHINLTGKGNYTGSLSLTFKITPAKIAVQYASVGAVPQYDRTAHAVNVTYENAEDDGNYTTLIDAGILSGSGDFTNPKPDQSVYSITYLARERKESGFGGAAEAAAITDTTVPINAGVYDVKIVLGSNDYQFVSGEEGSSFTPEEVSNGYSKTATGTHTILPAVVSYGYANSGEIYNRQAHTPQITFTNITYKTYKEKPSDKENPALKPLESLQYVVPQTSEYSVKISGDTTDDAAVNAGNYTVEVQLSSHNYCFSLTLDNIAGGLITNYTDGSTGEDNYSSCRNENKYHYTVRVGSSTEYSVNGSWNAPGAFVIEKATITLERFADSVYNRTAQAQTPAFSNTQSNNEAVPTLEGGNNVGVEVKANEYTITYKDENIISETDSLSEGVPYHSELYSIKIELIEAGAKNFEFRTKPIPAPSFTRKNITAAGNLLMQRYGEKGKEEDKSVLIAPFLINPAQITFSLAESSIPYDAQSHKLEYSKSTSGIVLTNSTNGDVLPDLKVGTETDVDQGALVYSYSGWAETSDDFKNVGTYTVKITLQEGGDFQFADGNYELSRDYSITAMDISVKEENEKEKENFNAATFTPDTTPGHEEYKIPAYHYTGKEIQPEITLTHKTLSDITLKTTEADTQKIGLRVAYTDNVNAGLATATLTGINNFTGTRVETFYVLPAIVSITASDGNNSSTFNPNENPEVVDSGSLTFSYNKTAQVLTYTFKNLCATEGNEDTAPLPNNADYVVEYYKADDWDTENNKPKKNATPLANGVVDAGEYFAWFHFVSGGKDFSNFVFYKEKSGSSLEDMFDTKNNAHLFAYGFKVTVHAAQIRIHLPTQFKDDKNSFVNKFPYTGTDYATILNSVTLSGENGVVPAAGDYTVSFYTKGDKENAVAKEARNAGYYYLAFLLTDSANNYQVKGVYVGDGTTVPVAMVGDSDGDGYYANNETLKNITVRFLVETAKIDVYLSGSFMKTEGDVNSFNKSFPFDKSDYASTLRAVTFKNAIEGGVIPINTEYWLTFKKGETSTSTVRNAGSYTLTFELTGDNAKNFVIRGLYAGTAENSYKLIETTDYTSTTEQYDTDEKAEWRKFEVAFEITTANIEIHLSGSFASDGAFNDSFVYDKTNRRTVLGGVDIVGSVTPNSSEYEVSFKTDLSGEDTTNDITNVGDYFLLFSFADAEGNYTVTNIYAGEGPTVSVPKAKSADEEGYYSAAGSMKNFSVKFDITPAEIDVYLANFKVDGAFAKEFDYNRSDWAVRLTQVDFKGKNGATIPSGDDYTIEVKKTLEASAATAAVNAGDYVLVFTLSNGNFKIVTVYADNKSAESPVAATVTKTDTNFNIPFTVKKAAIEVYLANSFNEGGTALNSAFVYNGTNWIPTLSVVQFQNVAKNGIVPTVGTDYEVTFGASAVINVASYTLTFALKGTDKDNYVIHAVYAGQTESGAYSLKDKTDYTKVGGESDPFTSFTVAFEITPAEITVHIADEFNGGESLKTNFPYNKTDYVTALKSVGFGGDTTPSSGEYEITFTAGESEPKATDTVLDAGKYHLVFTLKGAAAKNYLIEKIDTQTTGEGTAYELKPGDYTAGDPFISFTVDFAIEKATVDVYISPSFKGEKGFVDKFEYLRTNLAADLSRIDFVNSVDGTEPVSADYTLQFKNPDVTAEVTDAGDYTLTFTFSNLNFALGTIYAGTPSEVSTDYIAAGDKAPKEGNGFTVSFTINKAQIEVYLPEAFRSGSNFLNTFGFNKTDWATTLGAVQFKNVLRNGIVPQTSEYERVFTPVPATEGSKPNEVINVGKYQLKLTLTANKKNFYITAIYAGTPDAAEPDKPVTVPEDAAKGYVKLGDDDFLRSFSVAFEITPAEIQVHVPVQFRSDTDTFVSAFGFNKQSWAQVLNSVTLSGKDNIVPASGGYTVTFTDDKEVASDATNVGKYYLVFTFTDAASNNYVITGIYAGEGTDFDVREKGKDFYEARHGTIEGKNLTEFRISFTVTPAKLDLYLGAFRTEDEFISSFVFNGTDQIATLGTIEFKNEGNVVPAPEAYSITFSYSEGEVAGEPAAKVIDAGGYNFVFALLSDNYTLRNVYAGTIAQNTEDAVPVPLTNKDYTDKTEDSIALHFTLTAAVIDVYFTAAEFKPENTFVNNFYYDRNNWAIRLGVVSFENTMPGNSAVPQGTQYSIEFYKCDSYVEGESESWGRTSVPVEGLITDVGRYSVTFRLSKDGTGNYEGKKHYDNYTVNNVFVGNMGDDTAVELFPIDREEDPTGKDGYRKSAADADDVYVTLVFDIAPAVVKLEEIGNKVYNGKAQDAGFTFATVGKGDVLPQAGDYTAVYNKDEREGKATGNEKFAADGRPLNAGAYAVTIGFKGNFVFEKAAGSAADIDVNTEEGYFSITPAVLSAYLVTEEGDRVESLSMDYDRLAHKYGIATEMNSAESVDRIAEGDGKNCEQEITVKYNGWAGSETEVEKSGTDKVGDVSDGYTNAGTYTLTLTYYIEGKSVQGGNFCFGAGNYSTTLSYTILPRTITETDVTGIKNEDHKVYNGKPQTNGIVVSVVLVEGQAATTLKQYDVSTDTGDYSISNTSDVNVGDVTNVVTGMHNFQGAVNLSYSIDPATVTAEMDLREAFYNGSEQVRSFRFTNKDGNETVLPAYNATNTVNSDYTITYAYNGKTVTSPRNAGEYTVTVTLKNSTGIGDKSNFKFAEDLAGKQSDTVATFTFTVKRAEITLAVIPGASYTGSARPATVAFVNANDGSVVPKDYTITYDGQADAPVHVKTNGANRTPVAYDVKVTLYDRDTEDTGDRRDLSNFKFVAKAGDPETYTYDEAHGAWGQEAYLITPAVITGSLSVKIGGETQDPSSNVYNAKKHEVAVEFHNVEAGFTVVPNGVKGAVQTNGLVAAYDVMDGETHLYTLKITFSPNYIGFTSFDGIPENAGAYLVAVDLVSADFSFAMGEHAEWTYTIANAKIESVLSLWKADQKDASLFTRDLDFAPDDPHEITLTSNDFKFIDKEDGKFFNAANATFTFTACSGASFETITDSNGLTLGYKLTGAGIYTINVTVDAPNHDRRAITLQVDVRATAIKLTVTPEARFDAIYGEREAYAADAVLKQVLEFIRGGKITVEGLAGDAEEQAATLERYGFSIGIRASMDDFSNAGLLKAGDYGLRIADMAVSGFEGNFVVFAETGTTEYARTVFTVSPLAIRVDTLEGIKDLRYNGGSLVNDAASYVVISNIFAGDDVRFGSVAHRESEGGNFNNGSVFEKTEAVHVGSYWVHLFTSESDSDNGLDGADSGNYCIEEKDGNSDSIRYAGKKGVYVAFDILRRQVELAIADSTSTYGDFDAVYGTGGAKRFNVSYIDSVLTHDFGTGDGAVKLNNFILDLLALFDKDGANKLDPAKLPYPGAGTYLVKLDLDAGKTADGHEVWAIGDGKFTFDKDFVLHIDDATQRGTHTIGKREMRVNVHDYTSFYGDPLKEGGFEGMEGNWGFTPLDPFVDGDSEKDLMITIGRRASAFTAAGVSTTKAGFWPAHVYSDGLDPVSASANYEVKFSEGSGNYIIEARPITVLINRQESVYGEPRKTNLTGPTSWEVYYAESETNMGYAKGEGRSDLAITLTVDGIISSTAAARVYEDVVKGSSANPNYRVTFRNWVIKDGANEPGEREGGDYEITKRVIGIYIGSAEAVYGTQGIHEGMRIDLTAPVYGADASKPTNAAQWSYNVDVSPYQILPQDLGYLTFYLGRAEPNNPDTKFATQGTHAIVGVWGFGYDSDMTFMRSYDVRFFGGWEGSGTADPNYQKAGIFTVTPADITQARDAAWETSHVYRQGYDETERTENAGWYSLKIEAGSLVYAGDFTDASTGTLVFNEAKSDEDNLVYDVKVAGKVRATITYARPRNTTEAKQEVEKVDDLWAVHSVGVWEMTVTVEAANHKKATFIYTAYVVSVTAKVYLNMNKAAHETVYGEYVYISPEEGGGDPLNKPDLPLTEALQEYLAEAFMGVDGLKDAYPALSTPQLKQLILDNCWVEVIDAKLSSSHYLAAGKYHLRIIAQSGCGFTVTFVDGTPDDGVVDFSGYDRLIVHEKELNIGWIGNKELEIHESRPTLTDVITYTYSSFEYDFDPLFTNIIAGDDVKKPVRAFLDKDGIVIDSKHPPRDVGEYTIFIQPHLDGEDKDNYKLPETLEMKLYIVPMEVTVTLFDRSMTYGDEMPVNPLPAVNGDGTVIRSTAWTCDKIGKNDLADALGVKISFLGADGSVINRDSGAGVYRIVGSTDGTHDNYAVTFTNAANDGEEAVLRVYRASLTVEIGSCNPGNVYGDDQRTLDWEIVAGNLPSWKDKTDVKIKLTVGDGSAKNAGTYYIRGDWTNKNYNLVFIGDWTGDLPADYVQEAEDGTPLPAQPQGAGTYVIVQRTIRIALPETKTSYYGEFSYDGAKGTAKFESFVKDNAVVVGGSFPEGEDISNLKLHWTLPTSNNADTYTIRAAEVDDEDPNYEISFANDLIWTVVRKPITVTVHNQQSQYGNALIPLVASDGRFWTAKDLAPWHAANPYDALRITLRYEGVTDSSSAGMYRDSIKAEATENLNNYVITYRNDDGEVAGGTYVVEKRKITLDITDVVSDYGDGNRYTDSEFNAFIQGGYTLAEGSTLAPWDAENAAFKLSVVLEKEGGPTKDSGYHVGSYRITGRANDSNYEITFNEGTYKINQATNDWKQRFTLRSMNEGDTPDKELITAIAKFGDVKVEYFYDERCLFPVESTDNIDPADLSTYPTNTYYAMVTVEATDDYTDLSEKVKFVINESFLVVNGSLDVTLYVCIFASQFLILTCALVFLVPRKEEDKDAEATK